MTSQRGGGRVRTMNLRELGDVADTAPADGDVYTWSEAAQLFVPGAGSGTSLADSRLSAYVGTTVQSIGQGAQEALSTLVLDAAATVGSDLALNADGIHIDVLTPGTYLIQASVYFNNDHATTAVLCVGSAPADGLDGGAPTMATPVVAGYLPVGVCTFWAHCPAPGQIHINVCPVGGTDAETVNSGGIDVVRIH